MIAAQVLIVSDNAEFVREIMTYWELELNAPRLTVVSLEVCKQAGPIRCPLAIIGPTRGGGLGLSNLALPFESSVCAVVESDRLQVVRARHPEWLLIPKQPDWPEALLGLTREVLRRSAAEARAEEAENSGRAEMHYAALGGSLVKARPVLVDTLTALVGNADLILLSKQSAPEEAAEQRRTIHSMALRLNGILQHLFAQAGETTSAEQNSRIENSRMRSKDGY
jgi:hypothetical protein